MLHMTTDVFEQKLDRICQFLVEAIRKKQPASAAEFEQLVRRACIDYLGDEAEIDPHPPAQRFPDIVIGSFGIEVKFTVDDTWKAVGNSIQETQKYDEVKDIYVVFGKMGGTPDIRWGRYEDCICHVRTSHVPRFVLRMPHADELKESLFDHFGISYQNFRELDMAHKMYHIRKYALERHPDGQLWWLEGMDEHTLPAAVRLYTHLDKDTQIKYRAESALLCPEIVRSGRSKDKYDRVVFYMLLYHGVLCHQARDLFSAGSVANPQNDDQGGIYIARSLKLLEKDMKAAAGYLPDALFKQYWGKTVPRDKRIDAWLKKADEFAAPQWKPSDVLFRD